jgi:LmbE family N-acetylglucosaminyl deacetylase
MRLPLTRVLVIAPHCDDGEFGCGGTIAKFVASGIDLYYAALSAGERSEPETLPVKNLRREEAAKAAQELGIRSQNLITLDYEVRDFPQHRQSILDDMVRIGREIAPELVLLPSPADTHQDHQVVAQEGFRAFKKASLLGYEIPWNNLTFTTTSFVVLEAEHINKKVNAVKCYKTQQNRYYLREDFIMGLARARGTQIAAEFAEAFECIRWIL